MEHTILCIDDDANQLFLTKHLLERAGYFVLTARTAEQALKRVGLVKIDLVLSDHVLCGASGSEVAKQIKGLHPEIAVVLFSGIVAPPAESEAYIDLFISKDTEPACMLQQIASLLKAYSDNADK